MKLSKKKRPAVKIIPMFKKLSNNISPDSKESGDGSR